MYTDSESETMLTNVTLFSVKVELIDMLKFMSSVINCKLPNAYVLDLDECSIKIKQKERQLYLLKRYPNKNPTWDEYQLAILLKVAKESGFDYFLEPKYMN